MPPTQQPQMNLPITSFPNLSPDMAKKAFFEKFKESAFFWMFQVILNSSTPEESKAAINEIFNRWRQELIHDHDEFLTQFARMKLVPNGPPIPPQIKPPTIDEYKQYLDSFEADIRNFFSPHEDEENQDSDEQEPAGPVVLDFSSIKTPETPE